jgi:lauroyl/myristoyl acyltransferase
MATLAPHRIGAGETAPDEAGPARSSGSERATAAALSVTSWVVCHLPEALVRGVAEFVGLIWYLIAPGRRAQARRNLRRVAQALVADGRATPAARAAAGSRLGLERLVVAAFRHLGRYYLEVARAPAFDVERVSDRIEDRSSGIFAELVAEGLGHGGGPGTGVILVGLHFGALEFPSYLLAEAGIHLTAPMEVLDNAALQAYFMRTRSHKGLRLVPQERARDELVAVLERGEAVGLISDRVVRGRGTPALLFGHPVRFPAGAALLAMETGVPIYSAAVWRVGGGRYAGRMVRLDIPSTGPRPERIRAFLEAQASAFESFIAEAPEQWWSAFFPIWPDLEGSRLEAAAR